MISLLFLEKQIKLIKICTVYYIGRADEFHLCTFVCLARNTKGEGNTKGVMPT